MTISAKIIADSINAWGSRLTTMQVTCHRYILAEVNTHRVFSRNWRSSRAVPVSKLLKEARENPAMPVVWQANQSGMQGGEELTGEALSFVEGEWRRAATDAAHRAEAMMNAGLHKSWSNRVLEPYLYVHGVITSTEWDNFYKLRCHPDAQPEIRVLAEAMRTAQEASTPEPLKKGSWHLPYITQADMEEVAEFTRDPSTWLMYLQRMSVARCARVSYKNHDGSTSSLTKDLELYNRLVGAEPFHASPMEHQATPDVFYDAHKGWERPHQHGNFSGWRQLRRMTPGGIV